MNKTMKVRDLIQLLHDVQRDIKKNVMDFDLQIAYMGEVQGYPERMWADFVSIEIDQDNNSVLNLNTDDYDGEYEVYAKKPSKYYCKNGEENK